MLQRTILIFVMFSAYSMSHAELADLTESELSDVSGEGVALVYENFQFEMIGDVLNARDDGAGGVLPGGEAGNAFKITGIKDQANNDVNVAIAQYYISGTGSNLGTTLDGRLVNLGRLNNPITIDVLDGNTLGTGTNGWTNKSVLAIAMPTHVAMIDGYHCTDANALKGSGTCSSRPSAGSFHGERFDMGYRINRVFDGDINSAKNVNLNFHAQSVNMDGSYFRFWGSEDTDSSHAINMEIQMNFYASKLVFDSCDLDGSACGDQIGFEGFSMELALGDAEYYQPLTLDVSDTGFLHIMIQPLPSPTDSRVPGTTKVIATDGKLAGSDAATWNWYNDYYTSGRKTNISISNLKVGSENFGSSSIQGLQIQYLEVSFHDL